MPTFLDSPVEFSMTDTTDSFIDIDVSSACPAGATAAIVEIYSPTAADTNFTFGIRPNGNSTDTTVTIFDDRVGFYVVPLDSDRVFEYRNDDTSGTNKFYVHGYFGSEFTALGTWVDVTPGTNNTWTDTDLTAHISGSPTAVVFQSAGNLGGAAAGKSIVRANGSTDDFTAKNNMQTNCIICGMDGDDVVETFKSQTNTKIYLIGYITSGIVLTEPATDLSPTTGSYQDLTALPAGAIGGIYRTHTTTTNTYVRKNGSSDDRKELFGRENGLAIVECDASRICEAYVTSGTVYQIGYFNEEATISTGGLPRDTEFSKVDVGYADVGDAKIGKQDLGEKN